MLKYAKDPGVRSFAIGIAILVYAVELASFTLSIDEELYAYEPQPWLRWWIGQGRWTLALLGYIVPPLANTPFVPTAMFCVGLVVSALLLAGCYARSRPEAFAFVGFFVSCPIWLHIAETNTASWAFAVALCLGAAAVTLLHYGGYRASIAAGIATCLALGVYQALLPLVMCGSLLSVALNLRDSDRSEAPSLNDILRRLTPLGVSWLIAVLLYSGVTRLVLFFGDQRLTYVTSYVQWADFTSTATSSVAIDRTIRHLAGLLTGTDSTFVRWRWGIVSLLPAWLGTFAAIIRTFPPGREPLRTTMPAVVLVLGSAFSAFVPVIVSAGTAPTRTLVALPLLYAAGGASMMRHNWFGRKPHWVVCSFALFLNVWISATLFHADAIARDRDRIMAAQLAERLAALPGFQRDHPRVLILYGKWTHEIAGPAVRVEWFGTSFFEQDGGNPWRVERYLRLLGIQGLQGAYISCARDDIAELDGLPSWPAVGSVALVRDKLVIKLGPLSDEQRTNLAYVPCNL